MKVLPHNLTLSPSERAELRALIRCESSSFQFWLRCFATRGIVIPANKIPFMTELSFLDGTYKIEWTSRSLGPKAIAEGIRYRAYTEKKDKEFSARLTKRGFEV